MKRLLVFVLSVYSFSVYSQISVENVSNPEEFPSISLKIVDRNPTSKTSEDFIVNEEGGLVDFQLQNMGNIHPLNKVQNILILVENLYHEDRLQFYKNTLLNVIDKINISHFNINIAVFDRVRNQGTQSVFLLLDDYTSDKNKLLKAIENIQPKNDIFGNNKSSDLYLAVYEGLDNLNESFSSNKTLFVLSTGFNNKWSSHTSSESSKALAQKSNIAVYSLQYRIQGYEHHKLTDLVGVNYGKEIITYDENKAQIFLINSITKIANNLGKEYLIKYKSNHKESGETYYNYLTINDKQHPFTIKTKNKNAVLYYSIAGAILVLILFLILFKIYKNKRKNKAELEELEYKVQAEKDKSQELNRDLLRQKETLTNLKNTERNQIDKVKEEEAEKNQLYKMKLVGSLPILQFNSLNKDKKFLSFTMEKSLIKIGRSNANDIVLNEPTVSREHSNIYFKDGGYYITDLNSSAGTYVNGERIIEKELHHGNVIKLGTIEITFIL